MAVRVEHLDDLRVHVPVDPSQVPALAAALDRYQCDSVAELAQVLLLRAISVERMRLALQERRSAF